MPVYMGEPFLVELHQRLVASLEPISKRFEIILVDDRGPDDAWKVIGELATRDPRVRGVQPRGSPGQQSAIAAGLGTCAASGPWSWTRSPRSAGGDPAALRQSARGYDCALGATRGARDGWAKRASSWLFYKVFNALTDSASYDGSVANFSLVSRAIVDELNRMKEVSAFLRGRRSRGWVSSGRSWTCSTTPQAWRLVVHTGEARAPRREHHHRVLDQAAPALRLVRAPGGAPQRRHGRAHRRPRAPCTGAPVTGWPTLFVSIHFGTGTIVAALGVLGLYVERIFIQVKERPSYIVRARTDRR
ncbi:MAG: glycosyltransferase [Polyangiaceae bacterium]